MSNKKEKVYELDIIPLVQRLALVCKQEDIPFFMMFQDTNQSCFTHRSDGSASFDESSNIRLKALDLFAQSSSITDGVLSLITSGVIETKDYDSIIKALIKKSHEYGHESLFMKAMGIPEKLNGELIK